MSFPNKEKSNIFFSYRPTLKCSNCTYIGKPKNVIFNDREGIMVYLVVQSNGLLSMICLVLKFVSSNKCNGSKIVELTSVFWL